MVMKSLLGVVRKNEFLAELFTESNETRFESHHKKIGVTDIKLTHTKNKLLTPASQLLV